MVYVVSLDVTSALLQYDIYGSWVCKLFNIFYNNAKWTIVRAG